MVNGRKEIKFITLGILSRGRGTKKD